MSTIVIGSSGYLGSNLLHVFGSERIIRVTRSSLAPGLGCSIDLSSVVLDDSHPLFNMVPERVYVLARPAESDWTVNRRFYENLQKLLQKWCGNQELKAVYFTSTSNVYSIKESGVKSRFSDHAPDGEYEYFKLEFELFLKYLHFARRNDVDFYVFRLPIAFGGIFSPENNGNQYIYSFISSYEQGYAWEFHNVEEQTFGTSWVYTPDLVGKISSLEHIGGSFQIVNVASGFFTYRELHEMLVKRFGSRRVAPLRLYRSRMEIENEFELESRSIEAEIDRYLGLD
ncbi:NAD dependent epimerase/dehydratase family protein [Rubripirellula tenax]|uniref:NAD dependent epimerase/dehydratase family protein n=1 Tax=Rubripirellula tenax TaxID=2528015 RepID=A0A5C6EN38_9BACT|nr:NAD(P)-dependent oxidoreductase [Rubripirellula tenax]TWU48739.1 NAD dependent epimerase/dehydratase family protein [Rubripirellula tenax]